MAGVGPNPVAAPGADAAAHPPEADSGGGAENAGRAVSAGDQEAVWAAAGPGERPYDPERGAPSAHMSAAVRAGKSRMQTRIRGVKGSKGGRAGKGGKGGKGRPQASNITSLPLDAAPLTTTSIPAAIHGAGEPDTPSPVSFLIRGARREELDGVLNSIFSMSPTLTRFANEVARVIPEGSLSTHGIATMLAHPRFGSNEVLIPVMQELLDHARIVFTSLPRTVSLHTPHGPVRISFAQMLRMLLRKAVTCNPSADPALRMTAPPRGRQCQSPQQTKNPQQPPTAHALRAKHRQSLQQTGNLQQPTAHALRATAPPHRRHRQFLQQNQQQRPAAHARSL